MSQFVSDSFFNWPEHNDLVLQLFLPASSTHRIRFLKANLSAGPVTYKTNVIRPNESALSVFNPNPHGFLQTDLVLRWQLLPLPSTFPEDLVRLFEGSYPSSSLGEFPLILIPGTALTYFIGGTSTDIRLNYNEDCK